MKVARILFVIAIISTILSCKQTPHTTAKVSGTLGGSADISIVEHNGHTYMVFAIPNGITALPDPECVKCKQNKPK